ncbi:hypothetical protein EDC04DRAFT_2791584 [Pisolithus marmoratus]|nr:hypothetical protein EDC04DRAFT_2791584 [Pisolithus marmoratus]
MLLSLVTLSVCSSSVAILRAPFHTTFHPSVFLSVFVGIYGYVIPAARSFCGHSPSSRSEGQSWFHTASFPLPAQPALRPYFYYELWGRFNTCHFFPFYLAAQPDRRA